MIIPDGMIAKVAGSNQFKVGDGIHSWSQLAFMAPVTTGKGLTTASDGSLTIDFATMEAENKPLFESMLKSIKVPIWLTEKTGNMNFYVNGATGSDTLSQGRGLSASLPFKTIQACVNYVCDTYNLSRYHALICIDPGVVYNESLLLQNYTTNGGFISIRSSNYPNPVTINYNPKNKISQTFGFEEYTVGISKAQTYEFRYIDFVLTRDLGDIKCGSYYASNIKMYSTPSTFSFTNCNFKIVLTGDASNVSGTIYAFSMYSIKAGITTFYIMDKSLNFVIDTTCSKNVYGAIFNLHENSYVSLHSFATTTENATVYFDNKYGCNIRCYKNSVFGLSWEGSPTVFPIVTSHYTETELENVSKFTINSWSSLETSGRKYDTYFPGKMAGTKDNLSICT